MTIRRPGSRGFIFIELRGGDRHRQRRCKGVLCPPPVCDDLRQGVTLHYPTLQDGRRAGTAPLRRGVQ